MAQAMVGRTVRTREGSARVLAVRNASAAGSKFFGKFRFYVRTEDGRVWVAFGKTLSANSSLRPASDRELAEVAR